MKIKPGASIAGLHLCMRSALIAADKVWQELGKELVVTCGLDGDHSAGSVHYYGFAVDLRINYFSEFGKAAAHEHLTKKIGWNFDVVLKPDHIHVEFRDFDLFMRHYEKI